MCGSQIISKNKNWKSFKGEELERREKNILGGEIRSSKEKKKIGGKKNGYSWIGQVRLSDGFVLLGDRGHVR